MEDQILLTSRIRLARNVQGYPFSHKIDTEEANELRAKLFTALDRREDVWVQHDLANMAFLSTLYGIEENQISSALLKHKDKASFFTGKEGESILFLEEDHLRMQYMKPGLHLNEEYERMREVAEYLDQELHFSYDGELGFITACPTNLGTGLRASVMLHLPALSHTSMTEVNRIVNKNGFILRGMNGEGSESSGHIYQLSNEKTLGMREEEFVQRAQDLSLELVDLERMKRKNIYLDHLIDLEDVVKRSYGILRHGRILSYKEFLTHLSHVMLGIQLSVLKNQRDVDFYRETVNFGKAHLQMERGSYLDEKSSNIYRANRARKLMKEVF